MLACSEYQDFIERERLLTSRLLTQGYQFKELNRCQHLRSSMEGIMILSISTRWLFLDLYMIVLPRPSHNFVLRLYGPVNSMESCRARSVYLTTHLLGRLRALSG